MFLSGNWLRWRVVAAILAAGISCWAQGGSFRWYCDAKDGKFIITPCATCKKFYCWDGAIYSDEPGYKAPPGFVLAYWEQKHRESEQLRADLARKGKELKEQFEESVRETERLNRERGQQHKEFMDSVARKSAEIHAAAQHSPIAPPAARSGSMATTAIGQRARPKMETLDSGVTSGTIPGAAEPTPPPVSRAKLSEIQRGMAKDAVLEKLGAPRSKMSIPEDGILVETLTYLVEANASAKVRIENGKVVSVRLIE